MRDPVLDAAPGEARGDVIPMYDELIERLRETSVDFGESDHISVMMIEAADAIEELTREAEEYKAAWREEYQKRIAENRYLYDELTKAVREKLLMTPMQIVVPQPPEDGES